MDMIIEKSNGLATLTFNRPAIKNAMTFAMSREMVTFFQGLKHDAATRVVLIRGAGADFSSGADINDISTLLAADGATRSKAATGQMRELSVPLFLAMHDTPQPIVSSVRGYAVGAGVQIALMSDLVVASETARFVLAQVKLAHNVDHGESWALPRKVGVSRAMQLALMGDSVGGQEAERWGIANWVVPDGALEKKTEEVVSRLASGASVAVREIKNLLRGASRAEFEAQLEAEARGLAACAATDDFVEAINAFLQKRKPAFHGR